MDAWEGRAGVRLAEF